MFVFGLVAFILNNYQKFSLTSEEPTKSIWSEGNTDGIISMAYREVFRVSFPSEDQERTINEPDLY